jgi:hypothetical protein
MKKQDDRQTRKADTRQASTIIAVFSLVGLTACFIFAVSQKTNVPLYLYAIFGGGVLGTDNVLKFVRAIFRIDR